MKYIDADKLYEHLKQVDGLYPRYEDDIVDNAVSNVIDDIKTFISLQLQQEQPDKEDAMTGKEQKPKVIGYGVMRKMDAPHPVDWYMDESGKEHCWGYKFNEPCPWPAEVYIMEAKEDDASDH